MGKEMKKIIISCVVGVFCLGLSSNSHAKHDITITNCTDSDQGVAVYNANDSIYFSSASRQGVIKPRKDADLTCHESSEGYCWVFILGAEIYDKGLDASERKQDVDQYAYIKEGENKVMKTSLKGCPLSNTYTCGDPIFGLDADQVAKYVTCPDSDCVNPHIDLLTFKVTCEKDKD